MKGKHWNCNTLERKKKNNYEPLIVQIFTLKHIFFLIFSLMFCPLYKNYKITAFNYGPKNKEKKVNISEYNASTERINS